MNPSEQYENAPQEDADSRTPQVIQSGTGNLDKIRDILFGYQMRDYEMRFARLEESIAKETSEIRESSRRRFDQLEKYIKREFEVLESRIRAEREWRSASGNLHSRELKDLADQMQQRIEEVSNSLERRFEELGHGKTDGGLEL